jgi:hypothetical protein
MRRLRKAFSNALRTELRSALEGVIGMSDNEFALR